VAQVMFGSAIFPPDTAINFATRVSNVITDNISLPIKVVAYFVGLSIVISLLGAYLWSGWKEGESERHDMEKYISDQRYFDAMGHWPDRDEPVSRDFVKEESDRYTKDIGDI
jgi:hypothetical protein